MYLQTQPSTAVVIQELQLMVSQSWPKAFK